ncbi:MAG: hypothetical protein PWQ86_1001, partial [Bacillota bacterium]|nr:hypothetical protein [Bacillota bacterium]
KGPYFGLPQITVLGQAVLFIHLHSNVIVPNKSGRRGKV